MQKNGMLFLPSKEDTVDKKDSRELRFWADQCFEDTFRGPPGISRAGLGNFRLISMAPSFPESIYE